MGGGGRVGALFWRRGVGRGIACPELRALCVGASRTALIEVLDGVVIPGLSLAVS